MLAQELHQEGITVRVFAVHIQGVEDSAFPIKNALFKRGCRFNWPEQCLAWQLKLAIHRENPDFAIVMGITYLTRLLLKSPFSSKMVVWETTNANPGNKFIDEEAVRNIHRCLAILSPSPAIDRGIRETYAYEGNIVRLPYWIPDIPSPPFKTGVPFTYDFTYLGRLDVEKGINELITAFATVRKKRPARLAICGFGKAEPFRAKASELGIIESVDFYPNASEEAVGNVMQSARWYVLPSYHEGYPLSILEAARRGMPIIATSVGSVLEMVGRSEAALLIPPRNIEALVSVMEYTFDESELEYDRRCKAAWHMFSKLSGAAVIREHVASAIANLLNLSEKVHKGFSANPPLTILTGAL
jgi:glycosyltransferase involved in cell wall biosynthesis